MATLSLPHKIDKHSWLNGFVIGLLNIPFNINTKDVELHEQEIKSLLGQYIMCCLLITKKKKTMAGTMVSGFDDSVQQLYKTMLGANAPANPTVRCMLLDDIKQRLKTIHTVRENDTPIGDVTITIDGTNMLYAAVGVYLSEASIAKVYQIAVELLQHRN